MKTHQVAFKPQGTNCCGHFCNLKVILFCLVSVLALLEVDYTVARGNAHMVQFPCSVHVCLCVCVPV